MIFFLEDAFKWQNELVFKKMVSKTNVVLTFRYNDAVVGNKEVTPKRKLTRSTHSIYSGRNIWSLEMIL